LYQYLKHREKDIMALRVGSGLPNIQRSRLSGFEIYLPTLPEQTSIAEILSNMDAEITALEARRQKTSLLKQGMMQELLTGRIRLV
jgi:type I restriction enzyme S subunit